MEKLSENEIDVLAEIIATFEHPGSPDFPKEFRDVVTSQTSISEEAAEFLFEHMLSIDPTTRIALHFHHKEFVINTLDHFNKEKYDSLK